jgi:alanine racemase
MNIPFDKHTWAEIDLDALRANFACVRSRAGEMRLCAVVKADAYGHGAVQCAKALADAGAAWLAVSCLAEALQLRAAGLKLPILILGYTTPARAAALAEQKITQACFSREYATALSAEAQRAGVTVHVHLKADTGMGRIGFALRPEENFEPAIAAMQAVHALPGLRVTGLFQHFAVADSASGEDEAYTAEQHALFVRAYQRLAQAGVLGADAIVHCDNSAGVMLHPDWPQPPEPAALPRSRCMARPGIILYGFDPSGEVRFGCFKPVMKLKTVVSMVKDLPAGQSTSYGRCFCAEAPTRVATLCVGYADGYPRLLSNGVGVVELHGAPCRVLGRVCMDQIMVDVTALPDVKAGDEAILWGGAVSDSAETVAEKTGTIPYEVLCGVSRRVPRVYLQNGAVVAVDDELNG